MKNKRSSSSQQANTHLDSIIENALDAVITINSDGIITNWNKQAETTFGWSRQEAIGLRLSHTIIPPRYREAHEQGIKHYLATGEGTVSNQRIEITALHRAGHEFPVELTVTPLGLPDKVSFNAFVRDISKQQQTIQTMERSNKLLKTIAWAQTQFIAGGDVHTLFEGLLDDLLDLTQSEYGFIGEVRYKPGGEPYLKTHAITNIAWNEETRSFYDQYAQAGMEFYNLKTLFGAVMTSGEPVIANQPATDPRRGGLPAGHPALKAFLGLPFHIGRKLIGMVGVANRPDGYDEALIEYLKPFLTTCANIIEAFRNDQDRQKAEALLQESEIKTRAILDTADEGIITIDEHGIVDSFNPAAARIFDYSVDEVMGHNVSMLMPEPFHSRHDSYISNYLSTGQAKIIGVGREVEGRRKNGTIFPIYLAVSEVKLGHRRVFTGLVRDITDLKQAEESLQRLNEKLEQRVTERTAQLAQANDELSREITERKQLEQRYRLLFEEAPAMYVLTENIDNVPYIKDYNQLFASVLGYGRQEVVGRPLFDFYSAKSRDDLMEGGYQRALAGEFRVEDRQLLTKDDRVIETLLRARPEIDADGNVIGTRAMFTDITQRKQMEAAEREQRTMAEALHEAALIVGSTLDFDSVLDHILEQIARVVPYDGINIMLVENGRTQTVRLRGYEQFGEAVVQDVASLSFNVAETPNLHRLVETHQPFIIADTARFPGWKTEGITGHCRSWAAAPICIYDEVVAFLLLDKIEPDFYRPKDAERLAAFASQAAIAFENARLYQATQQQVKELTALNTISQAATSTLELDQILNVITDHIFQLLDIEAASLVLKDKTSGALRLATAAGTGAPLIKDRHIAPDQGIVGWCIKHGEPALVPDVSADPRFYSQFDRVTGHTTRSVLCVPLQIKGKTLGAIEVTNKKNGVFNQRDLNLLSSMAAPIASAIENGRLYDQIQRYAAELELRVAERTAELSAANAELARAARLKDEFLANMSHELRTPLNAILGMSEALQERTFGPLNEEQLEALHDVEESGRHLLTLINDILDLSKIEAGKLKPQIDSVAIESISQASLRLIKQSAHKKGLKVLYTSDEMVSTVQADERNLKQILVNLLSNAVKFTPDGGRIGLEIMGDATHDVVRLTVWDTGIGISAEDMGQLFQPFIQLDSRMKREYGGTGLGLALVYRLTELHGGSISVTSEPGKGSRFTVTLPWLEQENDVGITEAPQVVSLATSAETDNDKTDVTSSYPQLSDYRPLILLAEDNESNIKTLSRYLARSGFRVEVALNGIEAITQARVLQPDLILMDIQMPEMDGLEAIQHVRADPHLTDIPIIAVTALAMAGDRERCLTAGANEYVSKPVNLKMLVQTIAIQLQQSRDQI